jgi:hypothetical protein
MDALDDARNKFMGPEEDITEDSVLFERLDPKPTPVKKDTRCWTLGYSVEPNTNIEAPCANGKGIGGATAYNDTAQAVVTVSPLAPQINTHTTNTNLIQRPRQHWQWKTWSTHRR